MATYVRNNAWNDGGELTNPDLYWYAKGVGVMMSRALNDPASWWFFAAIHGEYVNPNNPWYPRPASFPGWGFVLAPPAVPTSPLPDPATQKLYWNQCQHSTWYFLPWHRGYLMALEAQLRKDIIALGGPATWSLPYWNYFGGQAGSQYLMPPAFQAKTLPDGSPNPLYCTMRYGPDGDQHIYIPTGAGESAHPNDPNFGDGQVTAAAMADNLYTGSNATTLPPGFGGPQTGFMHTGIGSTPGNLENNPHNLVHEYVGGGISNTNYGLMADPGTAGLDPIFYLHHANIDRMWAAWNANGNLNPSDPSWLSGPAQRFAMPGPDGQPWYYTPAQVMNLSVLNYSYEDLNISAAPALALLTKRLTQLGAAPEALSEANAAALQTTRPKQTELLGASTGSLRVASRGVTAPVHLAAPVKRLTVESLTKATTSTLPDRVFLKLENVRGTFDASVLRVHVAPAGQPTSGSGTKTLAGEVALFGLRRASAADGQHGGEGLNFVLDITPLVDQLHLGNAFDADALDVAVVPNRPLPDGADIEVGRISVFREAF